MAEQEWWNDSGKCAHMVDVRDDYIEEIMERINSDGIYEYALVRWSWGVGKLRCLWSSHSSIWFEKGEWG